MRGWEGVRLPHDPEDRTGPRPPLVPSEAARCARPAPDYRPSLRDRLDRDQALRRAALGILVLLVLVAVALGLALSVRPPAGVGGPGLGVGAPGLLGAPGLFGAPRATDAAHLRLVLHDAASGGPALRPPRLRG
jgi:hypothetical protein